MAKHVYSKLLWYFALISLPLYATDRVISLAPHTTELAYAVGLGSKLVAASAYSDYPPAAQHLEQVANWQGVNIERIITLKPDLILVWRGGTPQKILEQITRLGIPLFYSDPKNIDDIANDLARLAQYSPTPTQAQQKARIFRQQVIQLKQRYHNIPPHRILLQFGTQPLFSAGADTLQSHLLSLCHASNIFADSPVSWPQISREQVLLRHPDAIVITGNQQKKQQIQQFWEKQLNIPIITVSEDSFSRGSPRALQATEQLCQQLAIIPVRK